MSIRRKRRYVVVPDPSCPARVAVEVRLEGDKAGRTIAEFASLDAIAVHLVDFTDGDCESLFAAIRKSAHAFADAMNEAERVLRAAAEPAPETVAFEPYRKIARDPIPVFGRRKGRKEAEGKSPQDGDVLGSGDVLE